MKNRGIALILLALVIGEINIKINAIHQKLFPVNHVSDFNFYLLTIVIKLQNISHDA